MKTLPAGHRPVGGYYSTREDLHRPRVGGRVTQSWWLSRSTVNRLPAPLTVMASHTTTRVNHPAAQPLDGRVCVSCSRSVPACSLVAGIRSMRRLLALR